MSFFLDPKLLGALSQWLGKDSPSNPVAVLSQYLQGGGAGRGSVNPPMANPSAPAPVMAGRRPNVPTGALSPLQPQDVQRSPVQEAFADGGDQMGPPDSAMNAAPALTQAMGNGADVGPPASAMNQPGILDRIGKAVSQPGVLGRFGEGLMVAGSQDPAKALASVQDGRIAKQTMSNQQADRLKPKVTPIAGGAFSMVQAPDGSVQMVKNGDVAQYLDDQETQKMTNALAKIGYQAQTGASVAAQKLSDKQIADATPEMAQAQSHIKELRDIASQLGSVGPDGKFVKNSDGLTGPIMGALSGMPLVSGLPGVDKATELRNRAERVVQGGLRSVLGGQFTQNEGDRFLARAYNPSLDEASNHASLTRMADELEGLNNNRKAALDYFAQNKTLQGFTLPGAASPTGNAPAGAPPAQAPAQAAPAAPDMKAQASSAFGGYEPDKYDYRINPQTGRLQRKPKGQ